MRNDAVAAHFIGSIVYVEPALSTVTSQEAMLVIDGQPQLTTSCLLIAALANPIEKAELGEPLESFSARKLRNYYLLNPDEEGERHFKLLPDETDRDTLLAILQATPAPSEASTRIVENFQIFQDLIKEYETALLAVCKGIAKLTIVDVSLDRSQDNPQLIFESMNSTGRELSQADLIRNFILMGLEPKLQTELYKNYWRPMEKGFGQAAYAVHFDAFMRHYLTAKTGEIPNVREVYTAFKAYTRSFTGDTPDLAADIHAFATYYCAMALGEETDADLKQAFHDLRELKVRSLHQTAPRRIRGGKKGVACETRVDLGDSIRPSATANAARSLERSGHWSHRSANRCVRGRHRVSHLVGPTHQLPLKLRQLRHAPRGFWPAANTPKARRPSPCRRRSSIHFVACANRQGVEWWGHRWTGCARGTGSRFGGALAGLWTS